MGAKAKKPSTNARKNEPTRGNLATCIAPSSAQPFSDPSFYPSLAQMGVRVIRYRMVLGLWVLICDCVLSSEKNLADAKCKAQALT
jgi:hypothetical protein